MTPMSKLLIACVISLAIGSDLAANAATLPQLPQKQVATAMPTVNGLTFNATCATLQAQINAAAAANVNLTHEVILGPNGTTCTGSINLPSHSGGTGWILVKGTNYASLPAAGTRVSLSDATLMPKITHGNSGGVSAITTSSNAQRYRFIGIEFNQNNAVSSDTLIKLGPAHPAGTNTGYFIFDRVVIRDTRAHGASNTARGINGNAEAGNVGLLDSYCANIGQPGRESQCFQTDSNAGPILLQNNFLEAAGENTMLCGGVDPDSAGLIPQDATFKRNLYSVNSAWYAQGGGYVVKSLAEFKCGIRVLIEGNTFQNMPWDGAGFAHRLTVRNIFGGGTYSDLSDLTIRYNLYANVTSGFQIIATDDQVSTNPALYTIHSKRFHIHDNLIYGLGWLCGGGVTCGQLVSIQLGGGTCTDPVPTCKLEDFSFTHNTVDTVQMARFFCVMANGQIHLDLKDNVINIGTGGRGLYDCNGGFPGYGTQRLNDAWAGSTWSMVGNTIGGSWSGESFSNYPQGTNSYLLNSLQFLWTNALARDYTLQAGSPAKDSASDGTDRGVNWTAYNAARAGGSGGDLTPPAAPQNVSIR